MLVFLRLVFLADERFELVRLECEVDDRSEVFALPVTFRLPEDLDFPEVLDCLESLALDGVFDFTDFLDFVGVGDCPALFDVVWPRVFSNRSFFLLSSAFLEPLVFRDALAFPELLCFLLEFRDLPFFDQRFGLVFL